MEGTAREARMTGYDWSNPATASTHSRIYMNLLQAFGISEATDKLCDEAGIERIDWQRMTDETVEEIGRDCVECGDEAKLASKYCNAC